MNAIDFLDRGWTLGADRDCLVEAGTGERFSYGEVRRQTFLNGNAFRQRGYGIGSKASVLSHNSAKSFIVILSVMRTAMTYIPVNARNTMEHNAEILDRFDCDILFYQAEFADAIGIVRKIAPQIREFVCLDDPAGPDPGLAEWRADAVDSVFDIPHDPERAFEILPTSATTGFPKGVIFTNRMVESIVANFTAVAPVTARPVFLAVAPLTHLSGKFMNYIMSQGGSGVILPAPDRARILAAIPEFQVTHLFLPPTLIYDLLAEPASRATDYSSLRYFLYSASPMAADKVKEAIEVFGPILCQIWGQSEAAWCTALLPVDHLQGGDIASAQRLSSCGRPLPFVCVAVMDDDGNLLPDNERGELVVRGQCVMPSYYKNEQESAEVSQFGWHHSGDVGYRDEDGFFYIVDRKRDMIISGGFNIYSVEVETAILAHPAVLQCAVIGVPHEKWGETVKAVVELKPGLSASPDEIVAFSRASLGAMKAPKSVEIVDALPRSPIGKILKREVRQRYWGDRARMVS